MFILAAIARSASATVVTDPVCLSKWSGLVCHQTQTSRCYSDEVHEKLPFVSE